MAKKQLGLDKFLIVKKKKTAYTRVKGGKVESVKAHQQSYHTRPELSKEQKKIVKQGKSKSLVLDEYKDIILEIRDQQSKEFAPKISNEQLYLNQEKARIDKYKKEMEAKSKLKLTNTEKRILYVLSEDMSRLEDRYRMSGKNIITIMNEIAKETGDDLKTYKSVPYPILKNLVNKGILETISESDSKTGIKRTYYLISEDIGFEASIKLKKENKQDFFEKVKTKVKSEKVDKIKISDLKTGIKDVKGKIAEAKKEFTLETFKEQMQPIMNDPDALVKFQSASQMKLTSKEYKEVGRIIQHRLTELGVIMPGSYESLTPKQKAEVDEEHAIINLGGGTIPKESVAKVMGKGWGSKMIENQKIDIKSYNKYINYLVFTNSKKELLNIARTYKIKNASKQNKEQLAKAIELHTRLKYLKEGGSSSLNLRIEQLKSGKHYEDTIAINKLWKSYYDEDTGEGTPEYLKACERYHADGYLDLKQPKTIKKKEQANKFKFIPETDERSKWQGVPISIKKQKIDWDGLDNSKKELYEGWRKAGYNHLDSMIFSKRKMLPQPYGKPIEIKKEKYIKNE